MKHTLLVPSGLLVIGLCSSFFSAWACALIVGPSSGPTAVRGPVVTMSRSEVRTWYIEAQHGATFAHSFSAKSPASIQTQYPSWPPTGWPDAPRRLGEYLHVQPLRDGDKTVIKMYGWPMRCLAVLDSSASLPLDPIYRGLFLNTLFYALLWSIPLVVAPAFVRWLRSRRGGCPTRGYDISGLSACPECGTSDIESASA